jgi:aminopeptidase
MTPATRVTEEILALRDKERLLVVHDRENTPQALAIAYAAETRGLSPVRIELESLGPRPLGACPTSLLARIADADATVLAIADMGGEQPMRQAFVAAVAAAHGRHVHMVGVSARSFVESLTTSLVRVFELSETLRRTLRPSSRLTVRSAAGTRLEVDMAPHLRWMTNGSVVRRGEWVNVPCGALVSSPARVSGVYVADASMSGPEGAAAGLLTSRPIRLELEGARVRRVECPDPAIARVVMRFIAGPSGQDRVGLVNLGTNLGVLSPLGEVTHDETMPGLHLSLGQSFPSLTGATSTAAAQLAFAATLLDVDLDGEALVRRGRFVRFV